MDEHLDTLPNYLRLDMDTPSVTIVDLLLEKWGISQPNLIMSLFGESYIDIRWGILCTFNLIYICYYL